MGSNRTIVWFRRDLRIEDNPALAAASREGTIFPVYIWCPTEEGQFYPGRVSRWWLKHSLSHLNQSLKSLGAELVLIKTKSTFEALLECINAIQATKVVFNHLYGKYLCYKGGYCSDEPSVSNALARFEYCFLPIFDTTQVLDFPIVNELRVFCVKLLYIINL